MASDACQDDVDAKLEKFGQFMNEVKAIEARDADLTSDKQIERLTKPGSKYLNLNPYEVLKITPEATPEDIKKAFRKMSILVHPDKNASNREKAGKAFDAVHQANKILQNEEDTKRVKKILEEAEAMLNHQLKEKRKEAKKSGKESIPEDEDPYLFCKVRRAVTAKLFADYEIRRLELEERDMKERKRQREEEIADEEEKKKQKEWQKKWEDGRTERVDSWRSFQTTSKKSKKGYKPFKPPRNNPEQR